MKRNLLNLTIMSAFAALLSSGCLSDDSLRSNSGGGSVGGEQTVPDNSVIDARVFDALNLDAPELAAVKALYEADQYWRAAQSLLEYYRSRTSVSNDNVNLIATTITPQEQIYADAALKASDYCLHVEGYDGADKPKSYMNSGKNGINWAHNPSGEAEERYSLNRLAWMVPQGKAYRISLDENYVEEWGTVYTSWLEARPRPEGDNIDFTADPASAPEDIRDILYAWRTSDVACRIEDQCDLLYYFMQSKNFTPQLLSKFLANLAEQADHVAALYADEQDDETRAREAHSLFRAGTIFPEMKNAAKWKSEGGGEMNSGIDPALFDVLNLEYSGLSKVASAYNRGDLYGAAEELLNYYRNRAHDLNPNVTLATTTATDTEKSYADYALEYRFHVNNYDTDGGKPWSYLNDEGTAIDWTRYSDSSQDQERRYQINRLQWMVPQAKTYYVTKDERYAQNWIEVYGSWFESFPRTTVGTDLRSDFAWRPLEAATRLIDLCALLEYYQDSPSVTAEWLGEVLRRIDEHAEHLIAQAGNMDIYASNHRITTAQAEIFAGVLFPELKGAQRWSEHGASSLNDAVTSQYYADGWLLDGDFHYHISSIEDFRSSLRVAQLSNKENLFASSYLNSMRNMTEVVMNMIYPDYTVPNMTDTRRSTWTKSVLQRNLNNYCTMFPDNEGMLWLASEGKSGAKPDTRVTVFPDGGYYILRSGWTADDMMMVVQNNPDKTQWHRQPDNGTFELWVKGRNFFPDSGCYSYGGTTSSNAQRNKYAATTMHNTITLDDKNVTSEGTFTGQGSGSTSSVKYDFVKMHNTPYASMSHTRTVYMAGELFYVILDEIEGSAAGTLNLNFNIGNGGDEDSQVVFDADELGFHTTFADNNNIYVRTVSSLSGAQLKEQEGSVSYKIDDAVSRKAYSIDATKSADDTTVRFATLLLPCSNASAQTATLKVDNDGAVRVTIDSTVYTFRNNL